MLPAPSLIGAFTMPTTRADGCRIAASCFSCPLPECVAAIDRHERNAAIVRLTAEGWSAHQLAARYGLTIRHIRRIRAAAR